MTIYHPHASEVEKQAGSMPITVHSCHGSKALCLREKYPRANDLTDPGDAPEFQHKPVDTEEEDSETALMLDGHDPFLYFKK